MFTPCLSSLAGFCCLWAETLSCPILAALKCKINTVGRNGLNPLSNRFYSKGQWSTRKPALPSRHISNSEQANAIYYYALCSDIVIFISVLFVLCLFLCLCLFLFSDFFQWARSVSPLTKYLKPSHTVGQISSPFTSALLRDTILP